MDQKLDQKRRELKTQLVGRFMGVFISSYTARFSLKGFDTSTDAFWNSLKDFELIAEEIVQRNFDAKKEI